MIFKVTQYITDYVKVGDEYRHVEVENGYEVKSEDDLQTLLLTLIDFASGACYTVGGSLQKISRKIFMIVPQDMNLSGDFESLVSDMVDLNSVNIMK